MRHLFLILLFISGLRNYAQGPDDRFADSLQKRLAGAQSTGEKVHFLLELANVARDTARADQMALEALTAAELSRDRWLMANAYVRNGARYLNTQGLEGSLENALRNFETAERIAKEGGLSRLLTDSYASISSVWRIRGDNEKALAYGNLALAAAINTDNDSAKVRAYVSLGDVYREMKNMPLAFQHYSEALSMAEESKNARLARDAYMGLVYFYGRMHAYDKAIDYGMRVYLLDRQAWDVFNMLNDLNRIGQFFGSNEEPELERKMYEHSQALADTLHYGRFKVNSYFLIFNSYILNKHFVQALHYMQGRPEMLDFLVQFGYSFYPLEVKASAFTEEGRFDSAYYDFRAAEPMVADRGSNEMKVGFYQSFGDYYGKRRNYREAISYYQKAFALLTTAKDLEYERVAADTLQRLYERMGDYRSALFYNRLASAEGDSLRAQTRETELMRLEVETENRRQERAAMEEELNTERRHNIQYMGFTAGLVLVFISIVLLGRLPVPVAVIQTVVFLSFIFLFEFIILLTDRWIQIWTHEEPWKVLLIKIGLAAGLVPLHHWLEHRVIHYLSLRRRQGSAVAQKAH